jgi:hypothetical protein
LLCLLFITACSSFEQQVSPILLDKHSHYSVQAVPKEMWGQASLQKLLITTPQDKHELLLQTELRPNQINMVGLSAAGLVLFKLTWSNDEGLKINTNILAKGIDVQVMLAYYQLANWPLKDIQLGLKDLHVTLSSEDKQKRNFLRGGELVFSVIHTKQYSLMTHYIDHYQIEIETLQQSAIKY